jgi:hypothetical protein
MMPGIAMVQGITADAKSQQNHSPFKKSIVNNVNAEYGQSTQNKGEQCTMYGTED